MAILYMSHDFLLGGDSLYPAMRLLRHCCWSRLFEIVARANCFELDVKDISRIAQLRGVLITRATLFHAQTSARQVMHPAQANQHW